MQLSMLIPYLLIVAGSLIVSIFHPNSPDTTGYFYLATFNILTYVVLLATILGCHSCENRPVNAFYHPRHSRVLASQARAQLSKQNI